MTKFELMTQNIEMLRRLDGVWILNGKDVEEIYREVNDLLRKYVKP